MTPIKQGPGRSHHQKKNAIKQKVIRNKGFALTLVVIKKRFGILETVHFVILLFNCYSFFNTEFRLSYTATIDGKHEVTNSRW